MLNWCVKSLSQDSNQAKFELRLLKQKKWVWLNMLWYNNCKTQKWLQHNALPDFLILHSKMLLLLVKDYYYWLYYWFKCNFSQKRLPVATITSLKEWRSSLSPEALVIKCLIHFWTCGVVLQTILDWISKWLGTSEKQKWCDCELYTLFFSNTY